MSRNTIGNICIVLGGAALAVTIAFLMGAEIDARSDDQWKPANSTVTPVPVPFAIREYQTYLFNCVIIEQSGTISNIQCFPKGE